MTAEPNITSTTATPQKNKRTRGYGAVRAGMCISLGATVVSFAATYIPAATWVATLERALTRLLSPAALATTASTAGLSSMVITWLIERTEDRIYGARIADLIETQYKGFFFPNFAIFLVQTLLCILCGSSGLFWPTLYSGIGILIFMVLLIRVCYTFTIHTKERETVAFVYYRKACDKAHGNPAQVESVMLHAAEYSRASLLTEHNPTTAGSMLSLLRSAIGEPGESPQKAPETSHDLYCKDIPDATIRGIELSKKVWLSLMGVDSPWAAQKQVMISVLEALSTERTTARSERISILAGLVFAILDNCDKPSQLVDKIGNIKSSRFQAWVLPELFSITLLTIMILWLNDPPGNMFDITEKSLDHAALELWPEIHKAIQSDGSDGFSCLDELLFYAEWASRREVSMPLNLYVFKAMDKFSDSRSSELFISFHEPDHRTTMLTCLHLQALYNKTVGESN